MVPIGWPVELPSGLRTNLLDDAWLYAMSNPGRQMRTKVLLAAELAARKGIGRRDLRADAAAQAVELMHLASMVHDDVADDAYKRRRVPSIPSRYGAPIAAASGALFTGHGIELFARCGGDVVGIATEAAVRMCLGQMLELRSLYDVRRSPSEYHEAIRGKSAAMFWLASCAGAALGDADENTLRALARYGEALGIGHQVTDDIHDAKEVLAVLDGAEVPRGNDVRNGNYTLPIIYGIEECAKLPMLLERDAPLSDVAACLAGTEALVRARESAKQWLNSARDAVCELPASAGLAELVEEQFAVLGEEAE